MKYLKGLLVFLVSVGVFGVMTAKASNFDSFMMVMTPAVESGVAVEADVISFGTIALNGVFYASTTITNSGGVTNDWVINAQVGEQEWVLVTKRSTDTALGRDDIHLLAVLSATTTASIAGHSWVENDTLENLDQEGQWSPMFAGHHNGPHHTGPGDVDGDDVNAGEQRKVWFMLRTPSLTSTENEQEIHLSVIAQYGQYFEDNYVTP